MGQGSQTPTPAEGADNRTRTLRGSLAFSRAGEIAQLVEHTTENRGVPGSSPGLAIAMSRGAPSMSRAKGRTRRVGPRTNVGDGARLCSSDSRHYLAARPGNATLPRVVDVGGEDERGERGKPEDGDPGDAFDRARVTPGEDHEGEDQRD